MIRAGVESRSLAVDQGTVKRARFRTFLLSMHLVGFRRREGAPLLTEWLSVPPEDVEARG